MWQVASRAALALGFRRRNLASLLALFLVAAIIVWLKSQPEAATPFSLKASHEHQDPTDGGSVAESQVGSCRYPDFVLPGSKSRGSFSEFESDDPTARARVGPSPQLISSANFTVIYNFVSPKWDDNPEEDSADYNTTYQDFDGDKQRSPYTPGILTLATHATPEFLFPNVPNLLSHWPAPHPISVTVFAPGDDFCEASALISWLWTCDERVAKQVSFHVFFPSDLGADIASRTASEGIRVLEVDCSKTPDFAKSKKSYRFEKRLPYPVNAARNIARSASKTKHVLVNDVELYPSPNLANNFVEFSSKRSESKELSEKRIVYVLPIFEIERSANSFPGNKRELAKLYRSKTVVRFHRYTCAHCQKFPHLEEWLNDVDSTADGPDARVGVFREVKRHPPLHRWEPIYIGTHDEPLYDERLSWEGFQDKMTQMHELCLLDYTFGILDTAFLLHRPGVKKVKSASVEAWRAKFVASNKRVYSSIIASLETSYGRKDECRSKP